MAYINITETESVTPVTFDVIRNCVLMYGLGYNRKGDEFTRITKPTIFSNIVKFRMNTFSSAGDFIDRTLFYANDCLIKGLSVMFAPIDAYLPVSLEDEDGHIKYESITDEIMATTILKAISGDEDRGLKPLVTLSDRINCPVKFVTTCGYNAGDITTSDGYKQPALVDALLTGFNRYVNVGDDTKLIERFDVVILGDIDPEIHPDDVLSLGYGFSQKGKLVAFTYPWGMYNSYTGSEKKLPGSYGQLMAYANMVSSNAAWMAPAGVQRGIIPNLVALDYEISEAHQIAWQQESLNGFTINPIMELGTYGMVVFGNRTCYPRVEPYSQTYQKYLSVRLMLSEIHKAIYLTSLRNTFEPNDDILWLTYKQSVNELLDKMISGRGLDYYKWYKIKSSKVGQLKAKLVIKPIETVEEFDINIFMTDSDVEVLEGGNQ